MPRTDVLVVGAGISGLAFAYHAARAGRAVTVVEAGERSGGCLDSRTGPDGFWLELGAHTMYNSYGAVIELIEGVGLMGDLLPRGRSVLRFLRGDTLLPGANLGALLRRLRLGELLRHLPWGLRRARRPESVAERYSRLVGPSNYERVLAPLLAAVPSQRADDFPSELLFKKRPRRKDVRRSFTLRGGLAALTRALAAQPGVTVRTGRAAARVEPGRVVLSDGETLEAAVVCVATPPQDAARLLETSAPAVAEAARQVGQTTVDSIGVAVRSASTSLPYATFLIPEADAFHSIVTRDVVADPAWRGFVFHFKPGRVDEARMRTILGTDYELVGRRTTILPSPVVGHAGVIATLDGALARTGLAIVGNWFLGLSIEDCAQRARGEWLRVAGLVEAGRSA